MNNQFESTFEKHRNLILNKLNEGFFQKIGNALQNIILRDDDIRAKSYVTPYKTLKAACDQVIEKINEVEKYITDSKPELEYAATELRKLKGNAQKVNELMSNTLSDLEGYIKDEGNYADINIPLRFKGIEKEFEEIINKFKQVMQSVYKQDQGEQSWEKWQSPNRGSSPGKGPSKLLKRASRF